MQKEFTGMLPGAITKFEELLAAAAELNPVVVSGYDSAAGRDNFAYWGAGCRIQADDMAGLKAAAEGIGITWVSDEGDMAYTNSLAIEDFQMFRVDGNLELRPEKKEI